MGKDKTRKTEKKIQRKLETNPVGIHSVEDAEILEQVKHETSHPSSNEDQQSTIPSFVKDFDSVSESVRENACLALANIVLHENSSESDMLQFLSNEEDEEQNENSVFSEKQKRLIESSRQIWKTPQEVLLLMIQK